MLSTIPLEILNIIFSNLSRPQLSNVSQTCKVLYKKTLPQLFRHLEISSHVQIRQLLSGIDRSDFFFQNINQHTLHLTFSPNQQINHWRKQDLLNILGSNSQIRKLSFYGFNNLSMETIHDVLSMLNCLECVEFKYCNIINNDTATHYSLHETKRNNKVISSATRLSLEWTDFSLKSVQGFSCFSNITHIKLGANRNQNEGANEMLLKNLFEYCPLIHDMTVNLPLIKEATLTNLIIQYASQLRTLSLNCEGPRIINTISTYATCLDQLTLRGTRPLYTSATELSQLISKSHHLMRLDLISFVIQDIPMIIWKHLLKYEPNLAEEAIYKIKNTPVLAQERRRVYFSGIEESLSSGSREKKYDRMSITLNMFELKGMQN